MCIFQNRVSKIRLEIQPAYLVGCLVVDPGNTTSILQTSCYGRWPFTTGIVWCDSNLLWSIAKCRLPMNPCGSMQLIKQLLWIQKVLELVNAGCGIWRGCSMPGVVTRVIPMAYGCRYFSFLTVHHEVLVALKTRSCNIFDNDLRFTSTKIQFNSSCIAKDPRIFLFYPESKIGIEDSCYDCQGRCDRKSV